jgi:hypothetical protein
VPSISVFKRCLAAAVGLACLAGPVLPAGAHEGETHQGRLEIRHTDDFLHRESSTRYTLLQRQSRIAVRPTAPPRVASGSRVVVRGKKRGRVIRGDVRPLPGVRPAAAPLGTWDTAVLLFNFTSDRSQPWTPADVTQRLFTDSNSVNVFFQEQSWNQVDLAGQVYGWYELQQTGAGCDVDAWATEARQIATNAGVNLNAYDSVAYVFPDQADCNWGGLAELPGDELWLNGNISVRVASHELGHNMGVHHAASLRCTAGGAYVSISSNCTMSEYGDPFSTMGSSTRRMAGWHLQQLGYLQGSNVQTVTASGTYALRTSLSQTTDPVLLKIPRTPAGSPAQYYYLDLRSGGGVFDTYALSSPAATGVTIRIGNAPNVLSQSKLIDTTPGSYASQSSDVTDAPLAVGRTFSDGNVAITTTAISGGLATVDVVWGGPPPDVTPPSAPSITAATHYGNRVDVSWSAASDDVGVTAYRVRRNGVTVATVGGTSYSDTNASQYAQYSYRVEAIDAAGNATSSASVTSTRYVPPPTEDPTTDDPTIGDSAVLPPPDTTAPVVKIRTPGRNAKLRRRAVVRAIATDDERVDVIELWVDRVRLRVVRGGKLNVAWQLRRVKPGRHTITVIARDEAGNAAKRSVAVRVRR